MFIITLLLLQYYHTVSLILPVTLQLLDSYTLLDKTPSSDIQSFISTLAPQSVLLHANSAEENSVMYPHPQFPHKFFNDKSEWE